MLRAGDAVDRNAQLLEYLERADVRRRPWRHRPRAPCNARTFGVSVAADRAAGQEKGNERGSRKT